MAAFAPDHRDPDVVGFDRQRRPHAGDFERAGVGRVADQQVGRLQADRIERAAHRHAEVLIADAAAILDRRQQAGRHDMQATVSCRGVPDVVGRRDDQLAVGRLARSRSSYSRSDTGAKPTLSPGCSSGIAAPRLRSHSGTGQRPIRCQPHGVSAGKMQVMVIAIATDPAGIFIRGDCRRGSASSLGDVAQVRLAGQEAEHVDVVG